MTTWYAGTLALLAVLALVAVRAAEGGRWRALILFLVLAFLPVGFASMADLLSRPKPMTLAWAQATVPEAAVLGASIREGEGLFLLLDEGRGGEPRYYRVAWDRELAEQLQKALQEASRNGTTPMMRRPYERSWDDQEQKFYAPPQPKLPEKPEPGPGHRFQPKGGYGI